MTTTTTVTEPLYLAEARYRDFLGIEALAIEPHGGHAIVTGPNGSGKTSVITGLLTAFGIVPAKDIPEPVRHGAESARLEFALQDGDGVIRLTITGDFEGRTWRWAVKGTGGSIIQQPRKTLEALIADRATNPAAFLRLRPQDQSDEVLRVCGVEPPWEDVHTITGEHHPPQPNESASAYMERLSADTHGLYYDRRRQAHLTAQAKRTALTEALARLEQLGGPAGEVSVGVLLRERQGLEQQAERRQAAERDALTKRSLAREGHAKLKLLTEHESTLTAEIAELERQLEWKRKKLGDMTILIGRGNVRCVELDELAGRADQDLEAIDNPARALYEMDQRIEAAQKNAAALAKREAQVSAVKALEHESRAAMEDHGRADMILTRLRELRANLLNGVDLGIGGLAIVDGELRLKNVPLRQASLGERIVLACAIAARQNPRAHVMVIDDCEHLDARHRALLLDQCTRYGWQAILTVVRDQAQLAVEIVEKPGPRH